MPTTPNDGGESRRYRQRQRFRATSPEAEALPREIVAAVERDAAHTRQQELDALDQEIDRAQRTGTAIDLDAVHRGFTDGDVVLRPEEQVTMAPNHPGGPGAGLPVEERPQAITERMRAVSTMPDRYATWYRRLTVKRLSFRGIAPDKIAGQLNVSTKTVERDLAKINEELATQLLDKPVENYVAESLLFYQECRSISLRIATVETNTPSARLGGLDTAIRAQAGAEKLLDAVGYLKSRKVIPKKSDREKNVSQTDLMQQMIEALTRGQDITPEQVISNKEEEDQIMRFL